MADTTGNVYITGYFRVSSTFGSTTLVSQGSHNVFVAKLSNNGGENHPPNRPTITGPAKGKINVAINCNITTTDPNVDEVSFLIEWRDGTNSG